MNSLMANNISSHIKNFIFKENEKIANYIQEKIILDFTENYNLISDNLFKQYFIDNIFGKSIKSFFEKNNMDNSSSNFLNESIINEQNDKYIQYYKNVYKGIIQNDLKNLAYDFLDYQAIKEKETSKNLLNHNRRTHKDFIETSKNFLENNFNYISQILFIRNLVIQNYFIDDFKISLNKMTNDILNQNDIKKIISKCFLEKFKQFENEIKNKTPELMNESNNNFDFSKKNINEKEEKASSSFNKSATNSKKEEDNLPPAHGVPNFPYESQIEEKETKKSYEKSKINYEEEKSLGKNLEKTDKEKSSNNEKLSWEIRNLNNAFYISREE